MPPACSEDKTEFGGLTTFLLSGVSGFAPVLWSCAQGAPAWALHPPTLLRPPCPQLQLRAGILHHSPRSQHNMSCGNHGAQQVSELPQWDKGLTPWGTQHWCKHPAPSLGYWERSAELQPPWLGKGQPPRSPLLQHGAQHMVQGWRPSMAHSAREGTQNG